MKKTLYLFAVLAAAGMLVLDTAAAEEVPQPTTIELIKRIEELEARVAKLEKGASADEIVDLRRAITESERKLVGSWTLADESKAQDAGLVLFRCFPDGRCHVIRAVSFRGDILDPMTDKVFQAAGQTLTIKSTRHYFGALTYNRTIVSLTDDELVLSRKAGEGKVTESKYKRVELADEPKQR